MSYDVFLLDLDQKVFTKNLPHIFLACNLTLNDFYISSYLFVMIMENLLVIVMALTKLVFVLLTCDVCAAPSIILMKLLLVQIEASLADDIIFRCISGHLVEKERKDLPFLVHTVRFGTI